MTDRTHDLATCALPVCVETRRVIAARALTAVAAAAATAQRLAGASPARSRVLAYPDGRSRDVGAVARPVGPLTVVLDEETPA